jgi:hypothetical protein
MDKTKMEKLLVEAIGNILQDNLGFVEGGVEPEMAHHVQFQHEEIIDKFTVKVADSDFFENLVATFRKIHSYKWLSDPANHKFYGDQDGGTYGYGDHQATFVQAFASDLRNQGVPLEEIDRGIKAIEELQKEYVDGKNEGDVGYPENLGDIKKSIQEPGNEKISDLDKETMSGDNEPYSGAEPDNVRPSKNEA